jgi:hypothetical protein
MAVRRRRTKINSSDPPLVTVCTTNPTEPLPPFFNPPIELASMRPCRYLDRYRWIDFSPISLGKLLQVSVAEIHV